MKVSNIRGGAGRYDRAASEDIPFGTTVTLLTLDIPGNMSFRVTGFANYVGQVAALGNIEWNLLINGLERAPLNDIFDILGDQSQPWPVEDDRMVASGGDRITITATNSGGVNYEAGARLVGVFER